MSWNTRGAPLPIHRPIEHKASLASTAEYIVPVKPKQFSLKESLGLDGDDIDDEIDEDEPRQKNENAEEAVPLSRYRELEQRLHDEGVQRQNLQTQLNDAKQVILKITEEKDNQKQMTRSQMSIMKNNYEFKLKEKDSAVQILREAVDAVQKDPACVYHLETLVKKATEAQLLCSTKDVGELLGKQEELLTQINLLREEKRGWEQHRETQELQMRKKNQELESLKAGKGGAPVTPAGITTAGGDHTQCKEEYALMEQKYNNTRQKLKQAIEQLKQGGGADMEELARLREEVKKLQDVKKDAMKAVKKEFMPKVEQILRDKDAEKEEVEQKLQMHVEALEKLKAKYQAAKAGAKGGQAGQTDSDDVAVARLTEEVNSLKAQLEAKEAVGGGAKEEVQTLKAQLKKAVAELEELRGKYGAEVEEVTQKYEAVRKELDEAKKMYEELRRRYAETERAYETLKQSTGRADLLLRIQASCRALKESRLALRSEVMAVGRPTVTPRLILAIKRMNELSTEANERYKKELKERRRLYNVIQELKGNIRVYCRARPLTSSEAAAGETSCIEIVDDGEIIVDGPQGKKNFEFDHVFGPDSTQESVFEDTKPLVTSILDGFNVCIFAYGQTGSGKTFTMEGPEENPGVNHRAVKELFELARVQNAEEFDYEIKASLLEIYNESINDLLSDPKNIKKLDVRMGPKGPYIPDLNITPVSDVDELQALMKTGAQNRKVGATAMNTDSSRSHLVLTVYVDGTNKATGIKTIGKMNLVDLAGSERLSKSMATGDRLKEAQAINKSLSALGNVIAGLAQKNSHIPYRDSKLTTVLQDSLSGDSKTLMFVNIRPSGEHQSETICSLNFALRVRSVELGQAKKHIEGADRRSSPSPSIGSDDGADGSRKTPTPLSRKK